MTTLHPRTLKATELRPDATVSLSWESRDKRTLPATLIDAENGSTARVVSVQHFGDDLKVRTTSTLGLLTFVVKRSARVIVHMAKTVNVPHTPLGLAVALDMPGARAAAIGTRYEGDKPGFKDSIREALAA